MANINAAIGLEQLKRADEFRARKVELVRRYDQALDGIEGVRLIRHDLEESFPFFYQIRVLGGRRDTLMEYLKEVGVATGVHYIPNHIQPYFQEFKTALPITEHLFEEILTLPLYVDLTNEDHTRVIDGVRTFFNG
jgi:dTDP-4-amino-4,6-dideoxygalactose transaminase